jgi:hypothetical protein
MHAVAWIPDRSDVFLTGRPIVNGTAARHARTMLV